MKVGDMVRRRPVTFHEQEEGGAPKKVISGKVVYIHPRGFYHVVEFEIARGKVRESFLGVEE